MKTKQWIFLAVWFAGYIAALQFLRFKFGLIQISAFFLVIGFLGGLLLKRFRIL
jgi:hypothetical protein